MQKINMKNSLKEIILQLPEELNQGKTDFDITYLAKYNEKDKLQLC